MRPMRFPEGRRTFVLGLVTPILILSVLIPFYIWLNFRIIDWLQKS